jgi:hypothetical protein
MLTPKMLRCRVLKSAILALKQLMDSYLCVSTVLLTDCQDLPPIEGGLLESIHQYFKGVT